MGSYKFTSEPKKKRGNAPDSGISWLMAIACLFVTFILVGINRANGLLYVAYLTITGSSRQMASWPFNISGVAVILVAPLSGILATKFSPRVICMGGSLMVCVGAAGCFFSLDLYYASFFYGLVRGAGLVMATTLIPAIINQNFKIHRATAFGIATSGTPLGTFVFPAVTQYCLEEFGLKGTFLLLGGIALHSCIGASILGLRKEDDSLKLLNYTPRGSDNQNFDCSVSADIYVLSGPDISSVRTSRVITSYSENNVPKSEHFIGNSNHSTVVAHNPKGDASDNNNLPSLGENGNRALLCHILRTPHFYFLLVTQICVMNLNGTYTLVVVDYVIDKGVQEHDGFWMLTAFSVGEIVGRLGLGWVTDKRIISRQNFTGIQLVISGISLFLLTFAPSFVLQLVASCVIGITQGTLLSTCTILITDYLRLDAVTWTVALMRAGNGIIVIARAPIIGYFRDKLGSYDGLFQIISGMSFFLGILWFTDQIVINLRRKSKLKKTSSEGL